ncbi:MAG: hypothetical protein K1X74_14230 [Pirellulales bacterium]|nr:hypothetical protein [Pirellulales bacterium]
MTLNVSVPKVLAGIETGGLRAMGVAEHDFARFRTARQKHHGRFRQRTRAAQPGVDAMFHAPTVGAPPLVDRRWRSEP